MPKLTPAQQAQRRAHILDAAEVCFARAGFHRTTMQHICREASVSAGAVYLYFSSKEALIDGIVARDRDEISFELSRVSEAPDLLTGLEGLLRASVLNRPAHKIALYIEMVAEAGRNPQIAAAMNGCESVLLSALAEMVRQAQAKGGVSPDIDADATARLLLVMGDGLFVRMARRSGFDLERVVPHLLAMIETYMTSPRIGTSTHQAAASVQPDQIAHRAGATE